MNNRYQIFVSSTFRDLREERQASLEAILDMGHFPACMEVFPAANATPWALIEAIIKESDYYILIIGGMYGSTDENGVSYTEREYDLAVALSVPVLPFVHADPSVIPVGKSELSSDLRIQLERFRKKVQHHHCKYWKSAAELKAQVVIALTHAVRINPRIGWIRSNGQENPETLKKLTSALEENAMLSQQVKELRDSISVAVNEKIASGDDPIILRVHDSSGEILIETDWDEIFLAIGESLIMGIQEGVLGQILNIYLSRKNSSHVKIIREDFMLIIYQFIALDYIEPLTVQSNDRPRSGYRLTKRGLRLLAQKKAKQKKE